jgi:hypothetical protein
MSNIPEGRKFSCSAGKTYILACVQLAKIKYATEYGI